MRDRNRSHLTADDLARAVPNSSVFKVARVLLRAGGARDWFSGKPLYEPTRPWPQPMVAHHVFPKKLLYKDAIEDAPQRLERNRRANENANRAYLATDPPRDLGTTTPADYLPDIARHHPGALEAQGIPMDPVLWHIDQFPVFLEERRRLLAANINRYLDSLLPQADHDLDITALLAQDESDIFELKSSLRWDVNKQYKNMELELMVTKTVAAFLNSHGGTLLIGVSDIHEVLGLDADYKLLGKGRDGFDLTLNQILIRDLGAAAVSLVTVRFHAVDGRDICQVMVRPASSPVYLGKNQQLYVRIGGATRQLEGSAAVNYALAKWGRTS